MSENINRLLSVHMDDNSRRAYFDDINEALRVADKLQMEGFEFKLRDKCPKQMDESMWSARFMDRNGNIYETEHPKASCAICLAALNALEG